MASSSPSLMFTVRRCQPELVAPATPTPHQLKPLSDIDDQDGFRFQVPIIQIYHNQPSMAGKDPVEVIRQALAKTLVFYYPFAGRLREGPDRKLMVDCTGEGVMFIEADADVTLYQFGGEALQPPFPCFQELLYNVPETEEITNTPLLLIQVTRLRCGGFILATRMNHTMSDGAGLSQFMNTWAEMARGVKSPSIVPVWRRELLMARDPPRITCNHREYEHVPDTKEGTITSSYDNDNNMVHRSFFLGPVEIAALRRLIPHNLKYCTTFDIITACLWRCRTKALQIEADEDVRMMCIVNARARFNPPLPVGYYGNVFAYPAAITTAGKLCGNPFGYAVELINKVKREVTEEYMHSVADLLVIKGRCLFNTVRSYIVSDLSRAKFRNVDFGWGDAVFGGPAKCGAGAFPGVSYFTPGKNAKGEEGIIFAIGLPDEAMERFAKELNDMLRNQNQPQTSVSAMHRVGSASNGNNSTRPRKEKRLTYVLNDSDDSKHCAGINCLALLMSAASDGSDYLFTGSRDGRLKRWALGVDRATCLATFESHVDWVNDAVLVGDSTLVSCSSDTTLKTWNALSFGTCTRTLRQHSDYVTCLAAAEKNNNTVASGGLGGEVFIWDIEAALAPSKCNDAMVDESSNGINGSGNLLPLTSLRTINSSDNMSMHTTQTQGYVPISAKGHKDSVYALTMNESGTILVSGGTEKVVRVWDARSGSKTLKLRGHTDNIRALLLDSSGRIFRLYDKLYLTDLQTRESSLLCTGEHPILQLALHDDSIWVASTDSSVHRWPAEGCDPQKIFQRGNSFLAGNLSFSRARVSPEGSTPVPVYKEPTLTILGTPAIVQHEVLSNKRHVLTKDASGSVKLWEITKGIVVEDYGKVSIPAWFTVDTRLGSLSVHLDTPQCFSAEMYSADLNIVGKPEDDKVNLARETLKGLLAHWLRKRKQRMGSPAPANGELLSGKETASRSSTHSRIEVDGSSENDAMVYPPFEFSVTSPPSIITEGTHGGPWRKKITDLDGTKDEKDFPWWCLDCVLNNRLPPRENTKCSFYLQPCEGSSVQILTQGKLSAPRILRIHKVVNYVIEKMVLDKPLDSLSAEGSIAPGLTGSQSQHQAVLSPEMSLATVRAYVWKKSDDLVLNYRLVQGRFSCDYVKILLNNNSSWWRAVTVNFELYLAGVHTSAGHGGIVCIWHDDEGYSTQVWWFYPGPHAAGLVRFLNVRAEMERDPPRVTCK
ncbi:Benzyl alcohol O-benzoyltransferase [Glycine max]|nr:Benzyl alcohol O-benzoyltransferase [Glycine max]